MIIRLIILNKKGINFLVLIRSSKKFGSRRGILRGGKTDIIQYYLVKNINDPFPAHRTTLAKEEKEGGG